MNIRHILFAVMIAGFAAIATPAMATSIGDIEARVQAWQEATCPALEGWGKTWCIADFAFAKAKAKAFEAKAKIVEVATSQKTKEQIESAKTELKQLREAAEKKFAELRAKYAATADKAPTIPRN